MSRPASPAGSEGGLTPSKAALRSSNFLKDVAELPNLGQRRRSHEGGPHRAADMFSPDRHYDVRAMWTEWPLIWESLLEDLRGSEILSERDSILQAGRPPRSLQAWTADRANAPEDQSAPGESPTIAGAAGRSQYTLSNAVLEELHAVRRLLVRWSQEEGAHAFSSTQKRAFLRPAARARPPNARATPIWPAVAHLLPDARSRRTVCRRRSSTSGGAAARPSHLPPCSFRPAARRFARLARSPPQEETAHRQKTLAEQARGPLPLSAPSLHPRLTSQR